jgi:hypothetical protein
MNFDNWKKRWAHHRNILSRGQSEISLFYGVVSMSLLLWLSLRDAFTIPRAYGVFIVPAIIILAAVAQYLVGWVMVKIRFIEEIQRWDAEKNPMLKEILEKVNENSIRREHE